MGTCEVTDVYRDVTGWDSFEPMLSLIAGLDRADIWRMALEVPAQWYKNDATALDRLIETLTERCSILPELINVFRTSTYGRFLNWRH